MLIHSNFIPFFFTRSAISTVSNFNFMMLNLGMIMMSCTTSPPFFCLISCSSLSFDLFVTYLSTSLIIKVFLAFTLIGVITWYCFSFSLSTLDIFIRFLQSFAVSGMARKPSGSVASFATSTPRSWMAFSNISLASSVGAPGGFILTLSMMRENNDNN